MTQTRSGLWWGVAVAALLAASTASATPALPAPGTYAVQKDASTVSFDITELAINNVKGKFHGFSGSVIVGDSLATSRVEATVDLASVDTNIKKRDEHLRSEEWFDVQKFPTMTFKST